jgi:hypothetical protein
MTDSSLRSHTSPGQTDLTDSYFHKSQQTIQWLPNQQDRPARGSTRLQQARRQSEVSDFKIPPHSNSVFQIQNGINQTPAIHRADPFSTKSHGTSANGENEETVPTNPRMSMRMLQDGKGRLCKSSPSLSSGIFADLSTTRPLIDITVYLGDSASLSFLQLMRMNVEGVAGESAFTQDPKRFWITERKFTVPANHLHTHLLPERETADILVESFLTNVSGLIIHRLFLTES